MCFSFIYVGNTSKNNLSLFKDPQRLIKSTQSQTRRFQTTDRKTKDGGRVTASCWSIRCSNVFLQAVHTPLQIPKSYIYPYRDMANVARRKYAAMVSTVDEAVRNVTYALRKYGYYRNSVIIYSTDNGAQPFTGGSNWPLRGRKVENGLPCFERPAQMFQSVFTSL